MITVSVCTWNRAASLERCLAHIAAATPPSGPWELNVVDNNCTDGTSAVLAQFREVLPLRVIAEPNAGISHARNAAVANARGDWMLWTDDDVLVDRAWMATYDAAIRAHPERAFFGGPIRPVFEGGAPAWLLEVMDLVDCVFAARDFGPERFVIDTPRMLPYGANYAIRTDVQRAHGFDPSLGRQHLAGALGEETTALSNALASGATGLWLPEAQVQHSIPRHRQTREYIRSYFELLGRTYARLESDAGVPHLFGRPRWVVRRAISDEVKYRVASLFLPPRRWVPPMISASQAWGAWHEYPRRD